MLIFMKGSPVDIDRSHYIYEISAGGGTMEKSKQRIGWLDDFPGGVCLVSRDEEERILSVNQEILRIFECDTEEQFIDFTAGRFRGLMTAENYHSVEEMFHGHDTKGNYNFYSFSCETKKGHSLQIEGIIGPAEDRNLGPIWVLGLVRSDTRHWALERDLDTGLIGRHAFFKEAVRLKREIWEQEISAEEFLFLSTWSVFLLSMPIMG